MWIAVEQYNTAIPNITVNWSNKNIQDIVINSESIQLPKLIYTGEPHKHTW